MKMNIIFGEKESFDKLKPLKKFFISLVFGIIFLNGFVFVEPAPVEYLLTLSIPFFLILGKIRMKPLFIFLFLSFINLFSFLVTANITSTINIRFLIINLYMFLTFFLFSMINVKEFDKSFSDKLFMFWTISVFVNFFFYVVGVIISKNIFFGATVIGFGIRFQGFFKDPNVMGPFIIIPLMYWINKFLVKRNFASFLVVLFLSVSLLLTFSRGAYINFLVAFLFDIFLIKKLYSKVKFRNIFTIGVGMILIIVLILILNPVIFGVSIRDFAIQRFRIMQSYDVDRFKAQKAVIDLIKESPLFGIGIGNYNINVNYAAHNSFVRILGETGTIGFLLSILMLMFILSDRWLQLKNKTNNIAFVLYSCFVGILAESFFIDTLHWRFLWIILGLLYAI
jgi:O-antigen ligase